MMWTGTRALLEPVSATTWVPAAILVVSLGSLAAAFAGQFIFGLEPCILCLYQRIPYVATAVLAAAALVLPAGWWRCAAVAGCAGVFLAGAALAFYHVGVEQHWWGSIAGCGGQLVTDFTVQDLQASLAQPAPKPCDEVDWTLFGVSLAGYNAMMSLVFALASAIGAAQIRNEMKP